MKKNFLILYDQSWIQTALPTKRSQQYAIFTFRQVSFKNAPLETTKEGSKIADWWLMEQVNPQIFDGVIAVMNGNRLNGRNGVHIKKTSIRGRFSIMQVEARRGAYRYWVQGKDGKWFLAETKRKKKDAYPQLEYTFDHEIGHCLKYQAYEIDTLHTFVQNKMYEAFWQTVKMY